MRHYKKTFVLSICIFILLQPIFVSADVGDLEWDKTFGGPGYDVAYAVRQTSDNGYILAGATTSFGAGSGDLWLVKTDSDGNEQWNKTFGGSGSDTAYMNDCVQQTSDNGYIVTGFTNSFGAGGYDLWLVKTDSDGNEQWSKTFGGPGDDWAYSVQQTSDNGYIVAGSTASFGAGERDVWLVKTDPNGDLQWDKTFGGPNRDIAFSVQQTSDNGYIMAGTTYSFAAGLYDYWLVKTDSNGNEEWNKTFGGYGRDGVYSGQQTSDNGYIMAGHTNSFGAGWYDFWLVKTDSNGIEQWNNTFGGPGTELAMSVQQTSDNGYIMAGDTTSFGAGSYDFWVVKTDSNGNEEWNKTFGGSGQDNALSVQQTSDNGYIVAGQTNSFGAGGMDFWLVKLEGVMAPIADAGPDQMVHPGAVVTLDGSASSDPDEDYPLTYSWQITSKPEGSMAELSDPCAVNPSFIADMLDDYIIELVVTDSCGAQSAPDDVLISTFNTPPVADAGEDQAIIELYTTVQLDGTQSYDDEGDDFTYLWTITQKPAESLAELDDPCSATPTFVADIHGDYVISLIVTDIFGAVSDPDSVTVSFENVKPVADAGGNQGVIVGDTVFLDGSGSYDANFNLLGYSWSFVSVPAGSLAEIADPTSVQTSFVADEPGAYVVSLVVNDGFVDSDADNVTIMAITSQEAAAITLVETIETVNELDPNTLKNENLSNALTNKINAVLKMIDKGLYEDALDKLENDILQKTNGCAENGKPDSNDWIKTCDEQSQVYALVIEAIKLLENLI